MPRAKCPSCGRPIAVTRIIDPKLYRHDTQPRDPELKSCKGSFQHVRLEEGQQELFTDAPEQDETLF